ncbi:MAG: SGNH/GDSL hydrolase family protein [Deltaproteobacteria bacterium]|nr:SGNH/GDSL hydrolase family protein [Deltaproteobacteria bacterium]
MHPESPNQKLNICLLGGSNSLITFGIRRGISNLANEFNLALGGSTSLQNIYALTQHHAHIVEHIDAIVTESNVNDAHAIRSAGVSKTLIKKNVKNLYRELALSQKPTIALLLPLRQYMDNVVSADIAQEVREYHLEAIEQYGMDLVDVESALSEYTMDHVHTRKIIPDPFHPVDTFMYELGLNIGRHLADTVSKSDGTPFAPSFKIIRAEEMSARLRNKSNSFFNQNVLDITTPIRFNTGNGICVAIASWPDNQCELILKNDNVHIVKQLNSLYALNEFQQVVRGDVSLESNLGPSKGCTEGSTNTLPRNFLEHPVSLVGLLIENDVAETPVIVRKTKELSHLIPLAAVHIQSVRRVLKNMDLDVAPMTIDDVNLLRDAAARLESIDLKKALQLMQLAARFRPGGVIIREKIESYEKQLNSNATRKKKSVIERLKRHLK